MSGERRFCPPYTEVAHEQLLSRLIRIPLNPILLTVWITLVLGVEPTPRHEGLFPGYQYVFFLWVLAALASSWRSLPYVLWELRPLLAVFAWSALAALISGRIDALRTTGILTILTVGVFTVYRLVPMNRISCVLGTMGLLAAGQAALALGMHFWWDNQLTLPGGWHLQQAAFREPRLGGLYQHPNELGIIAFFGITGFSALWLTTLPRRAILGLIMLQGLLLYTLYMTGSRASILAAAIFFSFLFGLAVVPRLLRAINRERKTVPIIAAGVLMAALTIWHYRIPLLSLATRYLLHNRTGLSGREYAWQRSFAILKEHPWWGVGLGNDADYLRWGGLNTHNAYLGLTTELGWIGGILATLSLPLYIGVGLKIVGRDHFKLHSNLAKVCSAGLIAFAVHQLFEFQYVRVSPPYFLALMLVAFITTLRQSGEESQRELIVLEIR